MQVDSIGNEEVQTGRTMKRAMGLLAAVAVAMAAALATVDVPEADINPHVLKTDANDHRGGPGAASPQSAPAQPGRGELDPTLQRLDRGNDHHG
jgi:hypothetical protein